VPESAQEPLDEAQAQAAPEEADEIRVELETLRQWDSKLERDAKLEVLLNDERDYQELMKRCKRQRVEIPSPATVTPPASSPTPVKQELRTWGLPPAVPCCFSSMRPFPSQPVVLLL
jgi:hypothetical protein